MHAPKLQAQLHSPPNATPGLRRAAGGRSHIFRELQDETRADRRQRPYAGLPVVSALPLQETGGEPTFALSKNVRYIHSGSSPKGYGMHTNRSPDDDIVRRRPSASLWPRAMPRAQGARLSRGAGNAPESLVPEPRFRNGGGPVTLFERLHLRCKGAALLRPTMAVGATSRALSTAPIPYRQGRHTHHRGWGASER